MESAISKAQGVDGKSRTAAMWEFIFSTKMKVAAVVTSGLLVFLSVISKASSQETVVARFLAVLAVAATVMLFLRQRYSIFAWALLAAAGGVSIAVLGEPGNHSLLYWGGRLGTSLVLISFAYLLFRTGKRLGSSE